MSQIEEQPEDSEEDRSFQEWVLEDYRIRAERAQREYEIMKERIRGV